MDFSYEAHKLDFKTIPRYESATPIAFVDGRVRAAKGGLPSS